MSQPTTRRGGRPKARDLVMRVLYEAEITGDDAREVLDLAFGRFRFTEEGRRHAEVLLRAVTRHRTRLDETLQAGLENWDLARLGAVIRAILRLGAAELLYFKDTPARVVLDETLRLAHRYGDDRSAAFVNGVLDPVARRARPGEFETGA
ncbi:MAG: transcription antitermination factor NusB [Candidatus Eisenbacteria sp.]|nr:transcription antitermination factor NusB [Candidatus Eisenbacteria bacterium]